MKVYRFTFVLCRVTLIQYSPWQWWPYSVDLQQDLLTAAQLVAPPLLTAV